MMKLMNKKLTKKGFTLAELLIVVAILAILVAVSIPIFTSKLHDAKDSTDMANARAAKGAAVVAYLSAGSSAGATYYYDAENGVALDASVAGNVDKAKALTGYSQCNGGSGCSNADTVAKGTGKIVKVTIDANGSAKAVWILPSEAA